MTVFLPRTLEEAYGALARAPEAQLLAGGTDFMVEVNAGARRPQAVVSLRGVPELRGWQLKGHELVLGSGLAYTEMLEPQLADLVPLLATTAHKLPVAGARGPKTLSSASTGGGESGTPGLRSSGLPDR